MKLSNVREKDTHFKDRRNDNLLYLFGKQTQEIS